MSFAASADTDTKSFISPELAARLKQAETGDLVVTTTSENIEDVCTAVAWQGDVMIDVPSQLIAADAWPGTR